MKKEENKRTLGKVFINLICQRRAGMLCVLFNKRHYILVRFKEHFFNVSCFFMTCWSTDL